MVAAHVAPRVAGIGVVGLYRLFGSMGVACGSSRASSHRLTEVLPIVATPRLLTHAMLFVR